jgi:hypothetical protein
MAVVPVPAIVLWCAPPSAVPLSFDLVGVALFNLFVVLFGWGCFGMYVCFVRCVGAFEGLFDDAHFTGSFPGRVRPCSRRLPVLPTCPLTIVNNVSDFLILDLRFVLTQNVC